MTFDPALLEHLGGGLTAVVIIALACAVVALWRRGNVIQDRRIEDHKAHAAQTVEIIRTLEKAIQLVGGRNG